MNIENKKAAGYCRVKIGEQNEQSIEQQKYLISQYAEEYGYTITDWYYDHVWFDRPAVRPEYRRMMKAVGNDKIHGIVSPIISRCAI